MLFDTLLIAFFMPYAVMPAIAMLIRQSRRDAFDVRRHAAQRVTEAAQAHVERHDDACADAALVCCVAAATAPLSLQRAERYAR